MTKKLNMEEAPCFNCICLPMCKNKDYIKLINSCPTVSIYIYGESNMFSESKRNDDEIRRRGDNVFNYIYSSMEWVKDYLKE